MQGEPGVGKTTAALQFLMAGVANGERCLYVTLSQTKPELEAIAASHGWSLKGIRIEELAASDVVASAADQTIFQTADFRLGALDWRLNAPSMSTSRTASSTIRCSKFAF
jgi:circadian clock protein KaiC